MESGFSSFQKLLISDFIFNFYCGSLLSKKKMKIPKFTKIPCPLTVFVFCGFFFSFFFMFRNENWSIRQRNSWMTRNKRPIGLLVYTHNTIAVNAHITARY